MFIVFCVDFCVDYRFDIKNPEQRTYGLLFRKIYRHTDFVTGVRYNLIFQSSLAPRLPFPRFVCNALSSKSPATSNSNILPVCDRQTFRSLTFRSSPGAIFPKEQTPCSSRRSLYRATFRFLPSCSLRIPVVNYISRGSVHSARHTVFAFTRKLASMPLL